MFRSVGGGKTCAALCVLDYAGGDYWTAPEIAEIIIMAQQGRLVRRGSNGCDYTHGPEWLWDRVAATKLAVLDEIGIRNTVSDHQYDCLKRFCDLRASQPTIYISNLGPAELSALYDDRIVSRICAGTMIEVSETDRRTS